MSKTLAIIKPDALKNGLEGKIFEKILNNGFEIIEFKKIKLNSEMATAFYSEHVGKPFFSNLVNFMMGGEIIPLVLEKENAVEEFRKFIGPTNPKMAPIDSLRGLYGTSITENAIHGSDSIESAAREIKFFFWVNLAPQNILRIFKHINN